MSHTTQPNPDQNHPLVTVPWGRKKDLDKAGLLSKAYATCRRAEKGHCINTNVVRGFAKLQGRNIRSPGTYKGEFHWSEEVEGQWCMFVAPLTERYARTIDAYDHEGKHFNPPAVCPMGPVRFVGFCIKREDTAEQRKERRDRVEARVEEGKLVPGARFREPQTPYVQASLGRL